MFAARASKGGAAANLKDNSSGSSNRPQNESRAVDTNAEYALPHSAISSINRGKFFAYSADSDLESTWTPIRADIDDNTPRLPPRLGEGVPIDEDSIYSKTDKTLVAYFGPLPREVDEALSRTDFYTQPMAAKIDFDAGLGIIVSQSKCYIWAVQKDVTYRSPPMCISLPMPPNSYTSAEASVLLPVVTITKSDNQNSGVLACSPDGTCWYWNNIDLSLSNVDEHVDTKINLAQNDCITYVECAGPMGYYFGSRYACIYQMAIKKQLGSITLTSTQLHGKSGGAMASFYSIIGKTQGPDISQKVKSLTSGPKIQDQLGRWNLYVLTQRTLHRWCLHRSGEYAQEPEIPLKEKVTERILRDYSATLPLGSDPDVRLLDIDIPFLPREANSVTNTQKYPYTASALKEEDLRPLASPRLVVPKGGPGVFIVMPKAVIISSTSPKMDLEDLVPLKTDRIIGFGSEDWKQRGLEMEDSSELTIICKASGRLGINIQIDNSKSSSLPSSTLGDEPRSPKELLTEQLQAKLEQAVFFGRKKNNPISFDLTHYDGGDLNQASLNVSTEIMKSYAALLSSGKDLTGKLWERYTRITSIIESIQAAGMASRLTIDTRFQLCWAAEKLAAANALWSQYQLILIAKDRNSSTRKNLKQVMDDAASQSLQRLGANLSEDPISFFMNYHADNLAEFLSNLQRSTADLTSLSDGQQAELVRNINKIMILSLRSAWNYRKQNVASYALQKSCNFEPWTGAEKIIMAFSAQYMETLSTFKKHVDTKKKSLDVIRSSPSTDELLDQLCDLADVALQAFSERLQYLEGLPSSSVHNIAVVTAVNAYDKAKSELLTPLVELKRTQTAIELAQRYKDFDTLVKLCIGNENQIAAYIDIYQQDFANALFQWYYDNDQLSDLLEMGEKYSDLLTVYFDNRDYNKIAWLHDIKTKRFIGASQRVQDAAVLESNVNRRRTMLSLSKLLFMAGVTQEQQENGAANSDEMMKYASRNNEELEMATVQALLADEWDHKVGTLASIEERAQAIIKTFGSSILPEQPTLYKATLLAIRTLLNRQTISSEDLLDILMLQQKFEIQNLDICDVVLNICLHSSDIPENRRPYVLQDIWRRIFISGSVQDSYWKLEDMSEQEARDKLMNSWMCRAYAVVEQGSSGSRDDLVLLRPQDTKCTMPAELFKERFSAGMAVENEDDIAVDIDRNYKAMIRDYELENEELERRIHDGQLLEKWEQVKYIVKKEAVGSRAEAGSFLANQDVEMKDADL
ncbi:hypothetical protein BX616_007284 [Lobosporangium transversale]|nr:hypothetical protein BX616_007284 [Lobosporangium transversale]